MKPSLALLSLLVLLPHTACGNPPGSQGISSTPPNTPVTRVPSVLAQTTPSPTEGTPTQSTNLSVHPAALIAELPPISPPNGLIGIASHDPYAGRWSQLLDPSDGSRMPLPGPQGGVYSSSLSPDRTSLAFMSFVPTHTPRLVIVNNRGELRFDRALADPQEWFVTWHPSGAILLEQMRTSQYGNMRAFPFDVIAFDITTETTRDFPADLPGMFVPGTPLSMNWEEFSDVQTVYDTQMTMVAYPADMYDPDGGQIALYDLTQNRRVAGLPAVCFGGDSPRWSPDGLEVAFESYPPDRAPEYEDSCLIHLEELFALGRDGLATQLTSLSPHFDQVDIGPRSWSPNGNLIAFWMRTSPDVSCPDSVSSTAEFSEIPDRLAVLDVESGEVDAYCLRRPYSIKRPSGGSIILAATAPLWSPDSRYLVAEVAAGTRAILAVVDTQSRWAAEIAENARGLGWMKAQ